jgi:hypothetical protein
MLHVRFEGRSYDIPADQIRLNNAITDQQLFERLARHFDVNTQRFRHYVIDRRPNDVVIVRPEAVYG